MNRIYANIRLPIDVFPNGQFKMLYDQMKIDVEMTPNTDGEIHDKIMEMKEKMVENIFDNSNIQQEKEEEQEQEKEDANEIKIYKYDYPIHQIKKRMNTTFRKWAEKNTITRKKYIPMNLMKV